MSDTRINILRAASQRFADEGYGATSLSAVATAADTSKQVVLHHYGSKQGLYLNVLQEAQINLAAMITDAKEKEPTPREQLERVLLSLLNAENAELVRLTLRALLAVEHSEGHIGQWPLQPFLDSLSEIAVAASKRTIKEKLTIMSAVYGLLGSVSYYSISRDTLAGMYGTEGADELEHHFQEELRGRLAEL